MTEKMNGTSLDISAENRARLKALFPTVFTETKNDKGELVESVWCLQGQRIILPRA